MDETWLVNLKITIKRFEPPLNDVEALRLLFAANHYDVSRNATNTDIWKATLSDGSKVIFGGYLDGVREFTNGAIILPVAHTIVWEFVFKAAQAAKIVMFSAGKSDDAKSCLIILREEQRQYLPADFLKTFQVVLINSAKELQNHYESSNPEESPTATVPMAGSPTSREAEEKARVERERTQNPFLAPLTHEEKLAVSNLSTTLYEAIIKEKNGRDAPHIVSLDQSVLVALRKLSVLDIETLADAVRHCERADNLVASNPAEAARQYLRATEINPYFDVAFMSYGCSIANLGKMREGISWVEKSLAINPNNERARRNLQGMRAAL